jgi:holin-like protein
MEISVKYLKQFLIIISISFIGEVLKYIIPLPIPACIYGLVIMFVLLCTGIISLQKVEETGSFLTEIMPVMFVPAGVGLMEVWLTVKPILWQIAVMTLVSTIIVMVVAGLVTQTIIKIEKRHKNERTNM